MCNANLYLNNLIVALSTYPMKTANAQLSSSILENEGRHMVQPLEN